MPATVLRPQTDGEPIHSPHTGIHGAPGTATKAPISTDRNVDNRGVAGSCSDLLWAGSVALHPSICIFINTSV